MNKLYNVWKSNSKGDPIEGTDRTLKGKSLRWIMKHIAYEEGVEIYEGAKIVRLPNGDIWSGVLLR